MHRLSKAYPPDKTVLKDITLAFLPGAKIGVLGYNGAGKSTVLRIMAGTDTDYRGDAMLAPGATVGLLEQEPQLDEAKDVKGNVEDGVAETKALVERFNELAANYSDETADEFAAPAGAASRPPTPGTSTRRSSTRWTRCAARPPTPTSPGSPGGERRRVALCRLLLARPTCCCSTSRPTTSTPSRSTGWSATWPSTRARSSPSPTIATSSTTSPAGSSSSTAAAASPTRATTPRWLEQKQARLAQEEKGDKARQRTIAAELEWVRENPKGRRKKAEGAPEQLRGAARRGAQRQARRGPDPHPGGAAAGRRRRGGRGTAQGLRRPAADRGPLLHPAARRDRRRHRPQRRGQDDAVQDDHRPGAARRRRAARRRHRAAGLRRPDPRRAGRRQERLGGDLRRRGPDQGRRPLA